MMDGSTTAKHFASHPGHSSSFVAFFTIGRPISGVICLILHVTLIGCVPAAIWAVYALRQYKTDRKLNRR